MHKSTPTTSSGFTLLEILLVVAAISILAGIVVVAINPSKQLGDTKNAQRQSDTTTLLNAIYQYALDNNGNLPAGLDSVVASSQVFGTATNGCDTTCTGITTVAACADLTSALVPKYIVAIPKDPASGLDTNTDYYVNKDVAGRITVGACDPEQGAVIIKKK